MQSTANPAGGSTVTWERVVLCVLLLKLLLYVLDPGIHFFMGDSRSYLYAANAGWVPPDRSFYYPLFIYLCTLAGKSLTSLVIAQVLISTANCTVLAVILKRYFGTGMAVSCAAACLCAVEPVQLFYERSVMTETVSLFFFSLFVCFCLEYMRKPRLWAAFIAIAAGLLMTKMRMAFLPVYVFGLAWLVIHEVQSLAGHPANSPGQRHYLRVAARCAAIPLAALLMASGTHAVARHYGKLPRFSESGYFLLAAWAPLLAENRIPFGPDLTRIVKDMPCDLADYRSRNAQRWKKDCLIRRLRTTFRNDRKANRFAFRASLYLMMHDPLAIAELSVKTYIRYWNSDVLNKAARRHRGLNVPLSDTFRKQLLSAYGFHAEPYPDKGDMVARFFQEAKPWYKLITVFPLILVVMAFLEREHKSRAAFIAALYLLQLVVIVTLATQVSIRYLHPMAWLLVLGLGMTWNSLKRRKGAGFS